MKKNRKIGRSLVFNVFNVLWMTLFAIYCLIPIVIMLSASFSKDEALQQYGYSIVARGFTFQAYSVVFMNVIPLLRAYGVSFVVTGGGTLLNVFLTAMIAYPLSKPHFRYKSHITVLLLITMLFSPGMVPTYILITQYLKWKNTFAVMIIPQIGTTFYIILLRTFFKEIPAEIGESAKIDGCSAFREFLTINLPLSLPALATCSILVALGYWNDWGTAYLYVDDNRMWNVQMLMINLVQEVELWKKNFGLLAGTASSDSVVMATCVLGTLPILGVFMALQKYIVSGMTVGAVKG